MLEIVATPDDPVELRRAFGCFPSGVTAVCALAAGTPVGMAASAFTAVSLTPPLVSLCVQRTSTTWPRLRDCGRIGVSVMAEGQDAACRNLASKDGDRFDGIFWDVTDTGAVFVHGATAWLECGLTKEVPAGDHLIAILHVHRMTVQAQRQPLVFHGSRFRRLEDA